MLTLDLQKLTREPIPMATGWLLGSCMESRGKQDLWTQQKPEVLEVLREQAVIQSSESSNRIEGVTVSPERLRPIVIGRVRPRDRSEEELGGYRSGLDWIFSRKRRVDLTPDVVLRLHSLAQGGSAGDAGEWKKRDNEIIEIFPDGRASVRFVAVPAKKTGAMMASLCVRYRTGLETAAIPPLLLIATFVFDFLCIHPFRDGNGRVSRLTTSLLLQSSGFHVARYVSLERIIEENKEEYYRVLKHCSVGWHEGKNEIVPWWNFFLGTLRNAYKEFERQVESAQARPAKSDLIRRAILAQIEPFTLADISAQLKVVSTQLIKKVLAELKVEGHVRLAGHGRGARWETLR